MQIGDENVHRVRAVLDEVFGDENFCALITYRTSVPLTSVGLPGISDHIIGYAKKKAAYKYHDLFEFRDFGEKSRFTNVEFEDGRRRGLTAEEQSRPESSVGPEAGSDPSERHRGDRRECGSEAAQGL